MTESESLHPVVKRVCDLQRQLGATRSVLMGLSGIDASGKGFLAERLRRLLHKIGLNAAVIGVDGWLNLPHVRFSNVQPGLRFYEDGVRLEEMFGQLVLPLRDRRSIDVQMDYAEETASDYRRHRYRVCDVDVVLVEGIFLYKRELRPRFDLACWVDCSFETAMKRAIQRGQEGLTEAETIRAYETIYWPAQRVHFERDRPREIADLIINNDCGARTSVRSNTQIPPSPYKFQPEQRMRVAAD
jgi:uridine kinase